MRRKGELSSSDIDYGWPHQVALKAEMNQGMNYKPVHEFGEALGMCERGHTFTRSGEWYNVFCFRDKYSAQKFLTRFEGEWSDPETRRIEMRLEYEKSFRQSGRNLRRS